MDNRKYRRYFIILDKEDDGFENKQGKKPKGYAKIETKNGKGVLSQYIQNMKYFDNGEYIYRGYLIGTKDGKQLHADNGVFVIDENGKGELTWKFDPNNVDGKGNSLSDFNVIAIVAESAEKREKWEAPLVGFIDKKRVDWKHVLKNGHKIQEKLEVSKEQIIEKKAVQEIHDSNEEVKEAIVEKEDLKVEEVEHIEKEVEDIHKEALKEESVEAIGPMEQKTEGQKEVKVKKEEFTEEYPHKDSNDQHERIDYGEMKYYDCKNPHQYYHQYFKMICGYVENILKYYKEIEPFEKNIDDCRWWRIDFSQQTLYRNFLPFYGYVNNMYCYIPYKHYMGYYPQQVYKYKHYIFGIKSDKNNDPIYYLYGIPGRFIFNDQPYEGMTGFVYWHPIEDKSPEKGDYGYWILHIDAKTGKVAIPLKPTIPPR
ncbi:hypothetical protein [Crassaminicella indica]|uniref:DUF7922 domain-containing protein n=1 Tax=Crassaminicella indica TaxID=2855394 RepID=A0ABX8RDM6_9CLOT|nr:hypothetical protein [Crassaminicella indica]QXM06866.1 hypothetical protein KVH43_03845 [Crassaminicella indica]